jgi:hypothetical protein
MAARLSKNEYMNWRKTGPNILWIATALMWSAAAFGKLVNMEEFRSQLGESPLLAGFENLLLWTIPFGELLLVLAIRPAATRQLGFYISFTLLWLFTLYILSLLCYSHYVPCACSGFAEGLSWPWHIVFNLTFAILSYTGILVNRGTVKNS